MEICRCGCGRNVKTPGFFYCTGHALKGRKISEQHKARISASHMGIRPSAETLVKLRTSHLGQIPWIKGKTKATDPRVKTPSTCFKKGSTVNLGRKWSLARRLEHSKCITKMFKDPIKHKKIISAAVRGRAKRPTSLEKIVIKEIRKHKLPYRYAGKNAFSIGRKYPDFIHKEGKKICVEVRPKICCPFWGDKCTWQEYKKRKTTYYKKYGWKCLFIWWEDIKKDPETIKRILSKEFPASA